MSYIGAILVSLPVRKDNGPGFWVKVLFWPITILIYILGIIFLLLLIIPKNIFKGICICFGEIKDFFIYIWESAILSKEE
jgi:hypothetical protein